MDRATVLEWLKSHPQVVKGDAEALVSRCEQAVRRHAREDAWVSAKRYVAERQHEWEESHGAHASEAFVAREVCRQFADDLARHEPAPHAGDEDHLAGSSVKASLAHEGWEFMIPWIMEVARDEEHRTWQQIVSYTKGRAQELIRSHHLSGDTRFDQTRCYGDVAAQISGILARDFSEHAFPR
jgi:hypothetical protein